MKGEEEMDENNTVNENNIPKEYKPISPLGYIGYNILLGLPLIGIICALVFAFGGSTNKNVKNFARAYLILFVIVLAVIIIAAAVLGDAAYDIIKDAYNIK